MSGGTAAQPLHEASDIDEVLPLNVAAHDKKTTGESSATNVPRLYS